MVRCHPQLAHRCTQPTTEVRTNVGCCREHHRSRRTQTQSKQSMNSQSRRSSQVIQWVRPRRHAERDRRKGAWSRRRRHSLNRMGRWATGATWLFLPGGHRFCRFRPPATATYHADSARPGPTRSTAAAEKTAIWPIVDLHPFGVFRQGRCAGLPVLALREGIGIEVRGVVETLWLVETHAIGIRWSFDVDHASVLTCTMPVLILQVRLRYVGTVKWLDGAPFMSAA